MTKEELYYLDSRTKDGEYRVTTFSCVLEDLVEDFAQWMRDRDITFMNIEYAVVYRAEDFEPVADLVMSNDGYVVLTKREPDTRFFHRLIVAFRRLRNRL